MAIPDMWKFLAQDMIDSCRDVSKYLANNRESKKIYVNTTKAKR